MFGAHSPKPGDEVLRQSLRRHRPRAPHDCGGRLLAGNLAHQPLLVGHRSFLLLARFRRRRPLSFTVGPAAIHRCCAKKAVDRRRVEPERLSSFRRQTTLHVPVKSRLTAVPALPRNPGLGDSSPNRTSHLMVSTCHRFRRRLVPGTTRKHTNGCSTALHCIRTAPAVSYLRHTPSLRFFKHLSDRSGTGNHAGRHRPSPVSMNRHALVHVARGLPPRQSVLCPELPSRHSFQPHG